MKKAKTSPTEAAFPPQPYSAISEHDRARFKLQNLKQDYEDLLKDAQLKRRKLTIAKQRALKLKAEVRFLRRRYEFLIQNASPTPSRLKPIPQPTSNSLEHRQKTSKAAPILDLNQISFPVTTSNHTLRDFFDRDLSDDTTFSSQEGEAEFHIQSEATEMESFRRYLPEGESKSSLADVDVAGGLLKSPICRDAGNSSSRRGKRKVSWQDQVALKV